MLPPIDATTPVLIAGPTASGKSELALAIAERFGGHVVNADALQIYRGVEILTAQPTADDRARAPHHLYGHVPATAAHSVGDWLRALDPVFDAGRPIVVGGTGLYFRALTEGLADIPEIPAAVRAEAQARGADARLADLDVWDPATAGTLDRANPARVQRAWEVYRATGRSLRAWQADAHPPRLPLAATLPIVVEAPPPLLEPRIVARFDAMLAAGALDEVAALIPVWDTAVGARKAIGAPELKAHLEGALTLADARARAVVATRQFAKRQRTWFRARMGDWYKVPAGTLP